MVSRLHPGSPEEPRSSSSSSPLRASTMLRALCMPAWTTCWLTASVIAISPDHDGLGECRTTASESTSPGPATSDDWDVLAAGQLLSCPGHERGRPLAPRCSRWASPTPQGRPLSRLISLPAMSPNAARTGNPVHGAVRSRSSSISARRSASPPLQTAPRRAACSSPAMAAPPTSTGSPGLTS